MVMQSILDRLCNLETQLSNLSTRESSRRNSADLRISDSEALLEEMTLSEADILFQLYCLQLGIDADDLFGEEV